jgi:hypothetical protein
MPSLSSFRDTLKPFAELVSTMKAVMPFDAPFGSVFA